MGETEGTWEKDRDLVWVPGEGMRMKEESTGELWRVLKELTEVVKKDRATRKEDYAELSDRIEGLENWFTTTFKRHSETWEKVENFSLLDGSDEISG